MADVDVLADFDAVRRDRREHHELFGTRATPVHRVALLAAKLGEAAPYAIPIGTRGITAQNAHHLQLRCALLELAADALLAVESLDRHDLVLYHREQAHAAERAARRAMETGA